MLHALLIAVAIATAPEPTPAVFELQVTASSQTDYSIKLNDSVLKHGKVYRTEPLSSPCKVCVTVRFVDGDTVVENFVWLTLTPGRHRVYYLTIPRVVTRVETI